MEEKKSKTTCYYCIYGRPRKHDLCSIHRYYVKDIHTHTCDQFRLDDFMLRIEENKEKSSDDEGSKRMLLMAA